MGVSRLFNKGRATGVPYGETRHRALGFINGRLYALVFVETERGIRVISLRKANPREVRRYEQATRP